ncbi:MAG: TolC family protein, partial [Rhodospirillales bacterium]
MGFALVLPVFVLASALLAPGLLSRHAQAEDRNGRSGAARYDADGVLTVRRDAADRPFLPPEFLLPEELLNLQLPEIIRRAVESHDELVAQEKEVEASREESREALADWFPELDPTYSYGWQGQKKPAAKDTSLPYHDLSVSITQLLWDFGATNAAVEKARLDLVKEEIQLVEKRQAIILSALEAYVDLIRANKELAFARQSEDNILAQAGLEEERLSIGGGLSTDVLQAKRDLAGATARRVSAEGELEEARNGFLRYFSTLPDSVDDLQPLAEPIRRMPADLGEALETAQAKNARIRVAAIDEARARQDLRETRSSEFFPTIEAVMERNFKENDAGTAGRKQETEIRVEISLPFNLGMTAINTLRADQAISASGKLFIRSVEPFYNNNVFIGHF